MFQHLRFFCVLKRSVLYVLIFFIVQALFLPSTGQADVTLDGSFGPEKALVGPDYIIDAADGRLVDQTNLFHSFGNFNIDTGETATFTGPDTINSIIGRITGGSQSSIDGLLRSAIPGADLFLLNPAGFLFGPHASLDVQGSFHVSTADYLRLGESGILCADPIQSSVLTVDPPTAFGFLGDNPADISIQKSALEVPAGKTISLVGGDINIVGNEANDLVIAPGGRINLASVASPGEVILNSSSAVPELTMASFVELGEIDLLDAGVQSGGNGGGTVLIRGGHLEMDNSTIYASTWGAVGSGLPGAGIDIQIANSVVLNNDSYIGTNVLNGVADDSAGVRITANRLEVKNHSEIQSVAYGAWGDNPASLGNGGDITLTTYSLLLGDSSLIRAGTGGDGNGGDITITTDTLEVKGKGSIFSPVFGGTGSGGKITISAEHIMMSNEKYPGWASGISARTYYPGTGKGSDIKVDTKQLDMSPGTEISSGTWYLGQGGDIQVRVAGDVFIEGTKEQSPAGNPVYTGIFANTFWSADAGAIEISADNLEMTNNAGIQVQTVSTGNAGIATVSVGSLKLLDGSHITASGYYGSGGDAGKVDIVADNILISGPKNPDDSVGTPTGITTASSEWGGQGGDISILTDKLTLTNKGVITATSWGPDPGGEIAVSARNIEILNDAFISSGSFREGDAGDIYLGATDTFLMQNSAVTTESRMADGGNIKVDSQNLIHLMDSTITSSVGGGADTIGGNISIDPEFVVLNNSRIIANAYAGMGGNIDIVTDVFLADPESMVDASSTLGINGSVDIQAPITSVSGSIAPLPEDFRSVIALLRKPCMARIQQGKYSSFVINGRDGIPREPGLALQSPLLLQ